MRNERKTAVVLVCSLALAGGYAWVRALAGEATPNVMADTSSVTFAKQTGIPSPDVTAVVADAVNAPGIFSGDYVAAGVKGIALRIRTEGIIPSSCTLYIYNREQNREWRFPIRTLAPDTTEWQTVLIPLDFNAGWNLWDVGATEEKFNSDMRAVDSIGVRFLRRGITQQTYTIADFVLLGAANLGNAGAMYNFMLAYGIKDGRKDEDKDGLSNWGEFLANSNPYDRNSSFILRIERVQEGNGVKLKWSHIPGRKFAIWRSTDLKTFSRLTPAGAEKTSSEPENEERVDEEGSQSYFYKVEILE